MKGQEFGEKCGVFAVIGHNHAAELCHYGLYALQHRGQESSGIAVVRGNRIQTYKGMGLVAEVFSPEKIHELKGEIALGHVRYSTAGESSIENAQPLTVKTRHGFLSVAHNGNLTNARELRARLEERGSIFQTTLDTEVIPHLLAGSSADSVDQAFVETLDQVQGAYSLAVMTPGGVLAAKDPYGFRPLCLGKMEGAWIVSSETCGLDSIGATFVRELDPGEIIWIPWPGAEGSVTGNDVYAAARAGSALRVVRKGSYDRQALCVFEFIYFARPDSDIYGLNVHAVRKALGRKLARKAPCDADLVTGVPDSSLSAASGFAEESGIPYEMGLVKNRYIGRTFISPDQSTREFGVKVKLNPLRSLVEGKRVVLVDDSIVRGTTSRYMVGLMRSAGAREVHVRISSPPYRFPCYYGIDASKGRELAASAMSTEEIRRAIDADSLVYLDIQDVKDVLGTKVSGLCFSCFSGTYPVDAGSCGIPEE